MLERIITWSLAHRALVMGGAAAIALCGFLSLRSLNVDAFPDTTPIQVQINTAAPSLVPEEIERLITFPVELALGGMPGLQEVRSISQFGLSQVVVTFEDGVDIYFARQQIIERLANVEMPPGVPRPEMGPVSTGLGEVFHYLLVPAGENPADLNTLRTTQDWGIKPELRPVPGTAEVNSWGGLKKQYQVWIDPSRLFTYELTFQEVMDALRQNNLNVGGGNIVREGDMLLVHGVGRTVNIEQIRRIVIAAKEGVPIYVDDVAQVLIGHEIRRGAVTAFGNGEVVLGLGFMRMGENSYAVTRDLRGKFKSVAQTLPAGMQAMAVYDRTTLVDQVIATVKANLLDGALLVITILFIFLGNLRAGLIAAATIPLSMLFGFIGMKQIGIAGTLLSLGAIDFGIVVDSSVVVVENIVKHLAHHGLAPANLRRDRLEVIRKAAIEVRTPTVFGQLIIMIVYIPILTLEGVEGKMFRPMALTVMLILVGSLIMSLTVTPVLASLVLPRTMEEKDVWLVRLAKWLYAPVLRWVVSARFVVLLLALAALGATGWLATGFGTEFVPRLSEGSIVIGIIRPPGTSLDESIALNTRMEQALLAAFPDEIDSIWSRQGAPEVATDAGSIESTDIFIMLTDRQRWQRAGQQSELVELMEAELSPFKGQITWFTQPIEMRLNEMVSGVRADVALKLFGHDFETLVAKAHELENVLREIPGAADLSTEQVLGQPILQIRINQQEIARSGIPASLVLDVVESVGGKVVGEVVEDQLRFPLAVRVPEELRSNPSKIAGIMLATPSGERVPLSRVADIGEVRGPKLIGREWGKRRITVQCNVRGRDIGGFVAEAQQKVAEKVELPPGFRMTWGGQFENMQKAATRLTIVVPLALSLIVLLLYLTYRNPFDTTFVFFSVPFACVGGVLGLYLREMPLSISAAVGFITLSGVSVLSSMVFVAQYRTCLAQGAAPRDAIPQAALGCLRTVIMTALVASVGFVPMATSTGTGAEVQRPLATVVIGGVISSTLMTLFVLPALYALRTRRGPIAQAAALAVLEGAHG
ncbi:MAG: efflux RND transporter permease subunit [Planctomycetaceae bacterium]